MYLHLGSDCIVKTKEIIGIFDLENTSVARSTREYLAEAQKRGRVVTVSNEMPKSFCVCEQDERIVVYISPISAATLRKRTGYIDEISNL